jgi:K+-transporting ATPase ATPase B chain
MTNQTKKQTAYSREIYQHAIGASFIKLNPRLMMKNLVMFVVEVGSVLTTVLWIQALSGNGEAPTGFIGSIALWFTVLFANFSEAVAEGRGKAQAESLRKARQDTPAKKLRGEASDVQTALSKTEFVSCTAQERSLSGRSGRHSPRGRRDQRWDRLSG